MANSSHGHCAATHLLRKNTAFSASFNDGNNSQVVTGGGHGIGRALCERLAGVLSAEIDIAVLAEAEDEYVEQVSQAVATDADTAAYVEELEHRADSLDWLEETGLPSGDALAAEIVARGKVRSAAAWSKPKFGVSWIR